MKSNLRRGGGNADGIIILTILIVIVLISPRMESKAPTNQPFQGTQGNSPGQGLPNIISKDSSYSGNISINTGNARFSFQPSEEYITIYNRGREPIDITNWQLKNAKDKRTYYLGGTLQRFTADIALIPQGTLFVSPSGENQFRNIILEPGETAIVTTGQMGSQHPYRIVSFKENICSGYLGTMSEYKFTPSLSRNCPRPADEPGVEWLDIDCRNFIKNMQSCRVPQFETRNRDGSICYNCVDGKLLSSACVAFIKEKFNYRSCVANHQNDPKFSLRTWRIFLGQGWEMWAKEYESISLYDQFGRLVTEINY